MIKDKWMKKYNLAKEYYEEHGNLLIPAKYEVKDENGKIIKLGRWLISLRNSYKEGKLIQNQIDLLNEIGIVWNIRKEKKNNLITNKWMKNYLLAKEYYEEHGDLYIEQAEDEELLYLKKWVDIQRKLYINNDLEEYKINLLNNIGMVWNLKKYRLTSKRIEGYYELFLNNKLKESEIVWMLDEGYLKYTDDKIIKGNPLNVLKDV